MTTFDVIIGLEIHAELKTASKMFCRCKNDPFHGEPNEHICPVCFGLPGALPVPNAEAIAATYNVGQAVGATLNQTVKFDRKNYFYPDLPKGYQISQYDQPIASGGELPVGDGTVGLIRIHLEEDTGKLSHTPDGKSSNVDFNRSGVPLMELVTAPVISSAKQARQFCAEYQKLLRYLGIASADMEKGEMRCEANISLQVPGSYDRVGDEIVAKPGQQLNPKVEVKNLNSFRSVERAIEYEIKRQTTFLEKGEPLSQETRGWNEAKQRTVHQRGKESAHDYRYFPEPDIPELEAERWRQHIELPELPWQKRERYMAEEGITPEATDIICSDPVQATYTEQQAKETGAKLRTVISIFLNQLKRDPHKLPGSILGQVAKAVDDGSILKSALNSEFFDKLEQGVPLNEAYTLVESVDLVDLLDKVLSQHADAVASIKAGRLQAMQVLMGEVMRATKGRVPAQDIRWLLEKRLNEL